MIYLKSNAIGVDNLINKMINQLNTGLNVNRSWAVDIYHRVYREPKEGKYLPYAFSSGKDYKPVFVNDKSNGEIGFYLNPNREVDGNISVDCDIIFSLNLGKIDNSSLQREDEKAIMMALAIVRDFADVTAIKTQLRNVFADFDTERIKFQDMQPWINFSFTINLNYKTNNCYVM
jgi:hypothetical protein